MTDRECDSVQLVRDRDMPNDLSLLKASIISKALRGLLPLLTDDQLAVMSADILMSVDLVAVDEAGHATSDANERDARLVEFLKRDPGYEMTLKVFPSFLAAVDDWVHLKMNAHVECRSVLEKPIETGPPDPLGTPLLKDRTPIERWQWAVEQIEAERKRLAASGDRGRYVPGRSYGSMVFVMHPYPGFPNDGIWLLSDSRLYWINERDLALEALAQAGARAIKEVEAILFLNFIVVAGGVVLPGLASGAAAVLANPVGWTLMNPTTATALTVAGAEFGISIATGKDIPPVGQGDVLMMVAEVKETGLAVELAVEVSEVKATRQSVELLAGEIEATGSIRSATVVTESLSPRPLNSRTALFVKAVEAEASPATRGAGRAAVAVEEMSADALELERAAFKNRLVAIREAESASSGAGAAAAAVTPAVSPVSTSGAQLVPDLEVKVQLARRAARNSTARKALRLIDSTQDQDVMRAFNKFGRDPDFDQFITRAFNDSPTVRRPARMVMRVAEHAEEVLRTPGRKCAISFELERSLETRIGEQTRKGVIRKVDLWIDGWSIEAKSIRWGSLKKALVTGKKTDAKLADAAFGELQRDLFHLIGPEGNMPRARRALWVFDGDYMLGAPATREAKKDLERVIGDRLVGWLRAEGQIFENWKPDELEDIVRRMVLVF